jgi:hypothetical protein
MCFDNGMARQWMGLGHGPHDVAYQENRWAHVKDLGI